MSDDGFFFKPVDSSDARGRVEASFYEARGKRRAASPSRRVGSVMPSIALLSALMFACCAGTASGERVTR